MSDEVEAKVVSLFSNAPPLKALPPQEDVIERLEEMLQLAKDGQLVALYGAYGWQDGSTGSFLRGPINSAVVWRLHVISARATKLLLELEEDDEEANGP